MVRRIFVTFLVIVIAFALVAFAATFVRAFFYASDVEIEVPRETAVVQNPKLLPTRLIIPALEIDTIVQHVGVNAQGNMANPNNFTDVGWYKHGPTPGSRGSAVMAGHVNNGLGLNGVFTRLGELKPGDDIYVEREDGTRVHFIVTGSRAYPYKDAPTEVIFNPTGSIRLNLITCEGKWVKEDKTYDQRLVVFTKLAGKN